MTKFKTILLTIPLIACSGHKEIGADMLDARLCTYSKELVPPIQNAIENWNNASGHYTALSFVGPDEGCDVEVRPAALEHSEEHLKCASTDYTNADLILVDMDNCTPYTDLGRIMTHEAGHLFFGNWHSSVPEDIMFYRTSYQHITENDLSHLP